MSKTVSVPVSLIKKMSSAVNAFHELEEELDDFLMANDSALLKETEEAYREYKEKDSLSHREMRKKISDG